jgi:hypothetical protein
MKLMHVLVALVACCSWFESNKPLPKEVLERSVSTKPDRFMSKINSREHVSVGGLARRLALCTDPNGAKVQVKGPKLLSVEKYVVEGKETTRENLVIGVVSSKQEFAIELHFNQGSLLDVDEVEYQLQMRRGKSDVIDADRWFEELYKSNEKELKSFDELKGKAIDERKEDLFSAYKAFVSKQNVHDLKVFKVIDDYYFVGTKDKEEFLAPAPYDAKTMKHSISFFLPSQNRGTHSWAFYPQLFGSEEL